MESAFSSTQTLEALSKMRNDQQLAFGASAAVASAAIPVVDVSSLPSVPGRSASGASR